MFLAGFWVAGWWQRHFGRPGSDCHLARIRCCSLVRQLDSRSWYGSDNYCENRISDDMNPYESSTIVTSETLRTRRRRQMSSAEIFVETAMIAPMPTPPYLQLPIQSWAFAKRDTAEQILVGVTESCVRQRNHQRCQLVGRRYDLASGPCL
jgi:hypothetical protein